MVPKVTPEEAKRDAASLAALGMTQSEIAERLGYTQPRISQMLAEARREFAASQAASYEAMVEREHEHLLALRRALLDGIEAGSFKHVETAIKLSERVSRLLGLDHQDRMSERMVKIEEDKTRLVVLALAAVFDHLGLDGAARSEAIDVWEQRIAVGELM